MADVYTQHSCQVNVAKYSPSRFYIASADKSGKVRIWDTVNKEHILKNEFQPISGPIKDLAWSSDNQRIVVVGEGREKFGHVFLADTGTSNGDITGQTRPINTVDFKPSRPFRIVTGSEDNTAAVYEGPPFKFKGTKTEHTRYCQVVRYSPDGSMWASGGFDGKIFLYDGKDSELKGELSGYINYLDPEKPASPKRVIKGHNKPITSMGLSTDRRTIYTAASDGTVISWDSESGRNDRIGGKGHGVKVSGMVGGSQIQTIGYDDTIRTIDAGTGEYSGVAVSLSAQPKAIDTKNDMTFVCTMKGIMIMKAGSVLEEINVEYEPSCCAYSATHNHLVVGEANGNTLRVYSTVGGSTDLVQEIVLTGSAMDLSFSPDQKYLVSADSNRKVTLLTAGTYEKTTNKEWGFHTAKVNCVAWAPNPLYVASGGLDTSIILWSVEAPDKHCIIRNSHDQSQITNVAWLDNSSLLSTGQDANIKIWNVSWPN